MKYYDLEGNLFESENGQDRLLKLLYETAAGRFVLKILVSPAISKAGGVFLSLPLSKFIIKPFIRKNSIDMSRYENREYKSYNDFFTRKILKEKLSVDSDENVLVSPSDGKVSCYRIDEGSVFKIKGGSYDVASLLRDKALGEKFRGGYAFVIRLTVDDYHRYCYCCDGIKSGNRRIKGVLHTVNPVAFEHFEVFKENSREYCVIESEKFSEVVQLEVGATMVGKISNRKKSACRVFKGQEKGMFEFGGSTIVVLVKKDAVSAPELLLERTSQGAETVIKQGMKLGVKA